MCKFCKEIASLREVHRIASGRTTDAEMTEFGKYMQELSVAVVERTWYQKRGKKGAGRTVHFRNQGIGYALNFCPECGKKLRRR